MKRSEITAVIMFWLALTGLLTACHDDSSPSNPTPEPTANATTVIKDGVSYLLQTDKPLYHVGEPVQILCRATNNSNTTKHFGEVLYRYEIMLRVKDEHQTIWRHDNGTGWVPSCYVEFSLAPHESIEQSFDWMMHDNGTPDEYDDDFPATAGAYVVTCEFGNYLEPVASLSFRIQ